VRGPQPGRVCGSAGVCCGPGQHTEFCHEAGAAGQPVGAVLMSVREAGARLRVHCSLHEHWMCSTWVIVRGWLCVLLMGACGGGLLGHPCMDCCWLLAAGCWLLAAGCWLLAAGCWLLAAGKDCMCEFSMCQMSLFWFSIRIWQLDCLWWPWWCCLPACFVGGCAGHLPSGVQCLRVCSVR
jgi:hypothetical protein